MRLVCPNCEAKYEVPDDAIPDSGRDVQCANCGHAWYQMRPRAAAAETSVAPAAIAPAASVEEPAQAVPVTVTAVEVEPVADVADAAPEPEPQPDPELAPEPAETAVIDAEPDLEPAPAAEAEPEPDPEPPIAEPTVRSTVPAAGYAVDDSVLAILREEAEREAAARRAEARPLEVQTDLGIETLPAAPQAEIAGVDVAVDASADPVTIAESADPEDPVVVEEKPSARRDLLPDVEEINSTLRPSDSQTIEDDGEFAAVPRESGFRNGFLSVMVVAMIAVALYVGAPNLSRLVPGLAEPLSSYVAMGNDLRLALDGLMQSATKALNAE